MTQRYFDYAHYNIWASNRLINNIQEQDIKLLDQELVGSFTSIRATILHIWFAETGWLSRLNGNAWETEIVNNFSGDNETLLKSWSKSTEIFSDFVGTAELEKEIKFEHKGETFSIPTREIIQTVLNHGSYHRGQIVMMMRQLGVKQISQTDYIEWVRENERAKKATRN